MSDPATTDVRGAPLMDPDPAHRASHTTGATGPYPFAQPPFAQQWCHTRIGAEEAWAASTGGDDVLLGVIDSGISLDADGNLSHPDLRDGNRFQLGSDFIDTDGKPRDITGHGTAMTGIVAGMNWKSPVRICRVLDRTNQGSIAAFKSAIEEIIREGRAHGRRIVINYSAGSYVLSPELVEAVAPAADPDVLLCCPTGGNWRKVAFPAALSTSVAGIVAVGSTDRNDKVALRTGRGPAVTVVAPGVDILHPFPTYRVLGQVGVKHYSSSSGSSAATAIVSGLVSLIWSLRPNLTNTQVKQILVETAQKLAPGVERHHDWGYGRVDAAAALRKVLSF